MKPAVTDWKRDEQWFRKYLSMIPDIEDFKFVDSLDDDSLKFERDYDLSELLVENSVFIWLNQYTES